MLDIPSHHFYFQGLSDPKKKYKKEARKSPPKKGTTDFSRRRLIVITEFGKGEVSIALLRHTKPVELVEELDGEMEVKVGEDEEKVPH